MAEQKEPGDHLSPQEMRVWWAQEISDSAKAFELRVKEATGIVNAYALGELSPEAAGTRLRNYDRRWGEALYGASAGSGVTDESIVDQIDKARSSETTIAAGHVNRLVKRNSSETTR